MKIPFAACAVIAGVVVGFAAPARMAGHEPENNKKHHLYRLVDLGTLGGPESRVNVGGPPFLPGEQHTERPRKSRGGWGHGCSLICSRAVQIALSTGGFSSSGGVPRNLGVLPENATVRVPRAVLRLRVVELGLLDDRERDGRRTIREQRNRSIDGCPRCVCRRMESWEDCQSGHAGRKPEHGGSGESSRRRPRAWP